MSKAPGRREGRPKFYRLITTIEALFFFLFFSLFTTLLGTKGQLDSFRIFLEDMATAHGKFLAQFRHPATFRIFISIPHGHNCSSPCNVLYAWFSVSRFLRSLFIPALKFLSSPIPSPYSLSSHIPPNLFLTLFVIFFHHHIHFWKTM